MNIVLDVAFVIALVAFVKTQMGLTGRAVLFVAFLICVIFGIAPLIAALIPVAAPFIDVILKICVLFFGAAGSWDAAVAFKLKKTK